MMLPGLDTFQTFEQSAYFATVTFASLGYGDIVISGPWRMLSGIQAMNGLLVFGWSTALLFAVVERIWGGNEAPRDVDHYFPEIVRLPTAPSTKDRPSGKVAASA